jgi:hypothetical protein
VALGDVTTLSGDLLSVELLASATAANSAPSGASAGLDVGLLVSAFGTIPQTLTLFVASTAGSGTMTCALRLWGYYPTLAGGTWVPIGPGADSTKGTINEGQALGETGTNVIRHAEPVDLVGHFSRLYCEIVSIGGTSTAITAWLIARRLYGGN